jgi:hypothetical protein
MRLAGWDISVEVSSRDTGGAVYDDPGTVYDTARYDSVAGVGQWSPIDCQVLSVDCSRGTDAGQAPYIMAEAGRLSARLHDPDRLLDPAYTGTSVFAEAGAPVRVVATPATGDGGAVYDAVGSRYDTDDVYGGASVPVVIWTGTADSWTHDLLTGEGTLAAYDIIDRLAGIDVADLARPGENTVDRVGALIGSLGSQAPQTEYLGAGKPLRAATLSGDVRSVLSRVVESDMSWLWATASGSLRWMARDAPLPDPLLLVDCDDGLSMVYTQMSTDVGRARIVNEANVQRIGDEGEQRPGSRKYVAQDSRDKYGPRQYSANDLQLSTDLEVDGWAQALLDLRAYPRPALSTVTVEVQEILPWAVRCLTGLVGVDVGDPLTVSLVSRGDDQLFDTIVVGLSHSIQPGNWTTVLDVGPYTASWGGPPVTPEGVGVYDLSTYDGAWVYGTEVGTGVPPGATPAAGLYDDPSSIYDRLTVYDAAMAAHGRW